MHRPLSHIGIANSGPAAGRVPASVLIALGLVALTAAFLWWTFGEREPAAAPEEAAQHSLGVSPLERAPGIPGWLMPTVELADAARDEPWSTETLSARAGDRLRALEQALAHELQLDEVQRELAGEGLRCHLVRKSADAPVAEAQGPLQVQRDLFETGAGASDLMGTLAILLADFARDVPLRAKFEIFRVDDLEQSPAGQSFSTEASFQVHGAALRGGHLQQDSRWSCRWSSVGADPPRLTALEVSAIEQVAAAATTPLFADCTAAVLADVPAYRDSLLVGLGEWNSRLDKQLGTTVFGHCGLCIADFDGDGLDDVYLCQPAGLPNVLLLQNADGSARDAAAESGVDFLDHTASALALDLDGDGDQDLVVATDSVILLLENDGRGRFVRRGRIEIGEVYSLAAGDADNDGLLDLYACRYKLSALTTPTPYHDAENGDPNLFARCISPFEYEDATAAVGLDENNTRYSFAATWVDFDDDGDVDLYVANDFGRNNLYRNDGGHFTDVAAQAGVEDISAGMSVSWGDYDGDGHLDLYVGNMYSSSGSRVTHQPHFQIDGDDSKSGYYRRHARGNALFSSRGDGTFADVSEEAGVTMGRWAWASIFVDVDNDGREDIAIANGFITNQQPGDLCSFFWRQVVSNSPAERGGYRREYNDGWTALYEMIRQGRSFSGHERNNLYLNTGDDRFIDASAVSGFDFPDDSRAIAVSDWDQDGALDLWLTARTAPRVRFLRNTGAKHEGRHWVVFRLQGVNCNRDAVGARVELELADGRRLVRALIAGDGFLSQSSKELHFGLGATERVERLLVRWPGGEREDFGSLAAVDRRYLLVEGAGHAAPWSPQPAAAAGLAARRAPAGSDQTPVAFTGNMRAQLASPLPIAGFTYRDEAGAARKLTPERNWLLVQLWAHWCPNSVVGLRELALDARGIRAAGIDVLALSLDEKAALGDARRFLESIGWPFARGFASEDLVDAFSVVLEVIFEQPPKMALPTSFLLDPQSNLRVVFRGGVSPAELREAVALQTGARTPAEMREIATPFEGRWIARPRGPRLLTIANRLSDRGHLSSAAAYLAGIALRPEVTGASEGGRLLAGAHNRLGSRLAESGDHAQAVAIFERSLAIDPAQAGIRIELGHALRALGREDEALRQYEAAGVLQPGGFEAPRGYEEAGDGGL